MTDSENESRLAAALWESNRYRAALEESLGWRDLRDRLAHEYPNAAELRAMQRFWPPYGRRLQ